MWCVWRARNSIISLTTDSKCVRIYSHCIFMHDNFENVFFAAAAGAAAVVAVVVVVDSIYYFNFTYEYRTNEWQNEILKLRNRTKFHIPFDDTRHTDDKNATRGRSVKLNIFNLNKKTERTENTEKYLRPMWFQHNFQPIIDTLSMRLWI